MPGLVLFDYGDAIRFGANHNMEDESDLSKVQFDAHLFEVYTRGFLKGMGDRLTTLEIELLPNANKALMNLGQDPLFPASADDVNPIVMNGISTGTSNHDFFSQVGNGYLLGEVEAMQDDDYNYGL